MLKLITVSEDAESRVVVRGDDPRAELFYTVQGTSEEWEAHNALLEEAPELFDFMNNGQDFLERGNSRVVLVGENLFKYAVEYISPIEFTFETGGGNLHAVQSLETVGKYTRSGPPPPTNRFVGVTDDGVEGVDLIVPAYKFSETHTWPSKDAVTPEYRRVLRNLTGKVNGSAFKKYEKGEVLFLGATGARRAGGPWKVTYYFAVELNRENLTVGTGDDEIVGIRKEGWQYLWVRYKDAVRTVEGKKWLTKVPVAAFVERVYDYGDFSLLGIGTH